MSATAETTTWLELPKEFDGQWKVTTHSGATYLFDLDARTVQRAAGRDGNRFGEDFEVPLSIIDVTSIEIGLPLVVFVNTDLGEAWMRSTPVVRIEKVEA